MQLTGWHKVRAKGVGSGEHGVHCAGNQTMGRETGQRQLVALLQLQGKHLPTQSTLM